MNLLISFFCNGKFGFPGSEHCWCSFNVAVNSLTVLQHNVDPATTASHNGACTYPSDVAYLFHNNIIGNCFLGGVLFLYLCMRCEPLNSAYRYIDG
jgi:hypothetical protein